MRKLAIIKTKITVKKYSSGLITSDEAIRSNIDSAKIIENLLQIGETARRYALKGGHYKRNAIVETRLSKIKNSLKTSLEAYKKSHEIQLEFSHFAIINHLTLNTIYIIYGGEIKTFKKQERANLLKILLDNSKNLIAENNSFWDQTFQPTLDIYYLIQQDQKTTKKRQKELIEKITDNYAQNWYKGGSYRKSENILGHINFLIAILEKSISLKINKNSKSENKIIGTIGALKILKSNLSDLFSS